jgi:hypothetical protein
MRWDEMARKWGGKVEVKNGSSDREEIRSVKIFAIE